MRLFFLSFVCFLIAPVLYCQTEVIQPVLINDAYLKTANLSRSAFEMSKKIYFADKPAIKNALSDSLVLVFNELVFNTGILLKEQNIQKKVKSVIEDINKKTISYTGKVKEIRKAPTLEGKDAITEKIIFFCGSIVVNSYYAFLTASDNNPNIKGKLPNNTNLNDSLELLNADKSTNFLFMKEYIGYNSGLSFQIRDLQKYLATTMPKEERIEMEKLLEELKAEKSKNDHLLFLTVEQLNETREKIIQTIIEGYNLQEEFKAYDSNKDGKISIEEIYVTIDLFLEGGANLKSETIYSLIDFYLGSE
ncbi:MAG: hypothetical protein H0V01_07420 [Bacteroidetes bacterium]|nr:hypothetical protein [Bacteroidota bacterium]HET6244188.1 hypothetical protein [Bacteroidia bacterium]